MKHLQPFKGFSLNENIKLDLNELHDLDLDPDGMTLTVHYDRDGWDSEEEFRDAIQYAAENENDSLTYDVEEALSKHGLALDTSRDHRYDKKEGWIQYHLIGMNPMWVKIK